MSDDLRTRMSELRDRIAAVIYDHPNPLSREQCGELADAVIRELSDVLKTSNSHACGVHCPYGLKDERCHHWTTADDDEIRPALKKALASWDDEDA
jgi:hypothetical protein